MSFLVRERGAKHLNGQCRTTLCYHDSCSSLREMGVKREPRALLDSISGVIIRELNEPQVCCGFGGLFSVKYPEISERMADDKIADVESTGADTLVGGDLGCLLHLTGRMRRQGKTIHVRHAAEILAGMTDEPDLGESEEEA
jgi:L-lactate dehydrogenase complex protein LldE